MTGVIKMELNEDYLDEVRYIGLRIAYFRKLRGMTQAALADKVYINKHYLSHIESGSTQKVISLPLLIKIAKALDVELALLVDSSDFVRSKNEIREQLDDLKALFNEMKQFNAELDKAIAEFDNKDWD